MVADKFSVNEMFLDIISDQMKDEMELDINKIYELFPDTNKKTISWRLHKLVEQGKIYRTGYGYYALAEKKEHRAIGYDYLQNKSKWVYDTLMDYGYSFYISGLDSLIGELLHIPEQYPVILIVENDWVEDIKEILSNNNLFIVSEKDKRLLDDESIRKKIDVIILRGKDFSLALDNIADKEKGFVDLYFVVTRFEYGISIPELSRIYESMTRNHSFAMNKMIKAAKERGINTEIKWLLELKKASRKTIEFMDYQIREII